jgi:Predicted metal-dependent hydrolase
MYLQENKHNKRTKKRWSSCSLSGNLNFNWKIIMAPLSVIDYIVIHELTHLEELNHSERFWLKVKALMSNYEVKLAWLRENGHLLNI